MKVIDKNQEKAKEINRQLFLYELIDEYEYSRNNLPQKKKKSLIETIQTLEEVILANSGEDIFNELLKLIYAKLFDEWKVEERKNHELKFKKYKDPKITYKVISQLFEGAKNKWKEIFERTEKIKLTPEHLNVCVEELQEIKLLKSDLREIDEALEYLLPQVSKSRKGQYFTPRVITDATVKMLNPNQNEYIIDPACGGAGFLISAMQYTWNKYNIKDYKQKSDYAGKYLWGIDFDEKATKISKAIMLIASNGKTHIYKENSLEFNKWSEKIKAELKEENLAKSNNFRKLEFDILLANPPFAGDIKENQIKSLYSIIPENKKKKADSKISRHVLFIERALDMVKPGGRIAIVLPQGVFNNTNDRYIREFIMKKARILAVIGLHENSFKPHTGVKTSLIILKKYKEEELDEEGNPKIKDYPIFFAVSKVPFKDNSGNYILMKNKNKNILLDKKSNPIYQTDLFDIADSFIKWGKERLKKGDKAFDFLKTDKKF